MSKPEYTMHVRYRTPGGNCTHTRKIPWNWKPSRSDVFDAVRRLRGQVPNVRILGATLTREVLVERYIIQDPQEKPPNEVIQVTGTIE